MLFFARSDRESRKEKLERMAVKDEEPENTMSTMRISNPALDIIEKEDRLNQTVTCAEPSSPCREAAKGQ